MINTESAVVNFILAAREMARMGVPRSAESVRMFAFAAMGAPEALETAGLDPDKVVDAVWNVCFFPHKES